MVGIVLRPGGGRFWFIGRRGGDAIGAYPRLYSVESHAHDADAAITEHAPIACRCRAPHHELVTLAVDGRRWRGAVCLNCQVITHALWAPEECHGAELVRDLGFA